MRTHSRTRVLCWFLPQAFLAGSVLSCCCDRSPRLSSFSHTDLLVSHGSVGSSPPWASLAQIRVRASGLPPETPGRSCFLPFPASRGLPPSTVTAMVASLTSCCCGSVRPLPVHTRGPRAHVEPPQIAQASSCLRVSCPATSSPVATSPGMCAWGLDGGILGPLLCSLHTPLLLPETSSFSPCPLPTPTFSDPFSLKASLAGCDGASASLLVCATWTLGHLFGVAQVAAVYQVLCWSEGLRHPEAPCLSLGSSRPHVEPPSTCGAWLGPGWGSDLPALIVASALTSCVAWGKLHNLSDSVAHLKVGAVVMPAGIREDKVAQPLGRCRAWYHIYQWCFSCPGHWGPSPALPRATSSEDQSIVPPPAQPCSRWCISQDPQEEQAWVQPEGCTPGAWPALPMKACRLPTARALHLLLRAWTLDSVPPPSRNQKFLCSALSAQMTLPQRWT